MKLEKKTRTAIWKKDRKEKKPHGSHCHFCGKLIIQKHSGKDKNSNHNNHQCQLHLQTLSYQSQFCPKVKKKKEYYLLLSSWSCNTSRQLFLWPNLLFQENTSFSCWMREKNFSWQENRRLLSLSLRDFSVCLEIALYSASFLSMVLFHVQTLI